MRPIQKRKATSLADEAKFVADELAYWGGTGETESQQVMLTAAAILKKCAERLTPDGDQIAKAEAMRRARR